MYIVKGWDTVVEIANAQEYNDNSDDCDRKRRKH